MIFNMYKIIRGGKMMNARLLYINANKTNEVKKSNFENVKAKIKVSYDYNKHNLLNLNYLIKVGDTDYDYLITKCQYEISGYDCNLDEKIILNQAIDLLHERIEILIGILAEEIGIKLQS